MFARQLSSFRGLPGDARAVAAPRLMRRLATDRHDVAPQGVISPITLRNFPLFLDATLRVRSFRRLQMRHVCCCLTEGMLSVSSIESAGLRLGAGAD